MRLASNAASLTALAKIVFLTSVAGMLWMGRVASTIRDNCSRR